MASTVFDLTLGQASNGSLLAYTCAFTNNQGNPDLRVLMGGNPPTNEPIRSFAKNPNHRIQPWLSTVLKKSQEHLDPGLTSLGSVRWSIQSQDDYVNGATPPQPAELFRDIDTFLRRFYKAPEENHYTLLTLFIMMTYSFMLFETVPYIYVTGEPTSGKTILGTLLELLCFNGRQAASISPAALYGYLDSTRGTVVIDEQCNGNNVWKNVLLAGYRRSGAVMICDRGSNYPVNRNTFGPKIMLTNEPLAETPLASRFIELRAERCSGTLERLSPSRESDQLTSLRDALHIFGLTCAETIAKYYWAAGTKSTLSHRDADLAAPLLAIAEVIDNSSTDTSTEKAIIQFLERETERKRLSYQLDADAPALARAVQEFVGDNENLQVSGNPGFYIAQNFTRFVNQRRFLDRHLETREIGRKLNMAKLIAERKVVDVQETTSGSVQLPGCNGKRQQRRAYCFDESKARALSGGMP